MNQASIEEKHGSPSVCKLSPRSHSGKTAETWRRFKRFFSVSISPFQCSECAWFYPFTPIRATKKIFTVKLFVNTRCAPRVQPPDIR